jgi:hypothetical protein
MQATVHIKDDEFFNDYEKLGYKSKSAMINDALATLKAKNLEDYRMQLKEELLDAYKPSDSWEGFLEKVGELGAKDLSSLKTNVALLLEIREQHLPGEKKNG